jgi:hypothetical protein
MVEGMRAKIEALGGEYRFGQPHRPASRAGRDGPAGCAA